MENICIVLYKYICFMSILLDYADYQVEVPELILRKLDPPLYNITNGMPSIPQKWPQIQQYLLAGNIYQVVEALLEATSRMDVSFEPESFP